MKLMNLAEYLRHAGQVAFMHAQTKVILLFLRVR